jgi:hypothetical protein
VWFLNKTDYLDELIVQLMDEAEEDKQYVNDDYLAIDIKTGRALVVGTWYGFRERKLFDDRLELILPEEFELISPEEDFAHEPQTKLVMVGENDEVQIFMEHTEDEVANDEEVVAYKDKAQRLFRSVNPSIEWLGEGDRHINNRQIVFFEFTSPTSDGRIYNLTFFLRMSQRILRGFFICPYHRLKSWKQVFDQIIESMKIKAQEETVEAPVARRDYTHNPFSEGLYGIYHGREFLMFRVGEEHYRLISTNSSDCEDGFYPQDGVYKKTVNRNEITAAYRLKLVLTYHGYLFDLGQKQRNQVELVMANEDYGIARNLGMEMGESRHFVKWIAKKDVENVTVHRLAVEGFKMPENMTAQFDKEAL